MVMLWAGLFRKKELEIASYQRWRVEPMCYYYSIAVLPEHKHRTVPNTYITLTTDELDKARQRRVLNQSPV